VFNNQELTCLAWLTYFILKLFVTIIFFFKKRDIAIPNRWKNTSKIKIFYLHLSCASNGYFWGFSYIDITFLLNVSYLTKNKLIFLHHFDAYKFSFLKSFHYFYNPFKALNLPYIKLLFHTLVLDYFHKKISSILL
jgi:hypothetical protein